MKKVLILNSFIKKYTGSEITTFELAKTFRELGFEVSVAAFDLDQPFICEFEKLAIRLVNICNLKNNEFYDIIWAHHFITLEYCLLDKEIRANKVVFSSLSPYTPLESPPFVLDKVSVFLANSLETKEKLISMGIAEENIRLFPNPVPSYFFNIKKCFEKCEKVRKIAIISNHLPQELLELTQIGFNHDIEIDIIGVGFKETLITPEILLNYDAVISIGKTVQYCLSLGIPVYCYDMFGGSGWVNSNNINHLGEYNFSGRDSYKKKSALEILAEIKEYNISNSELDVLIEYSKNNYNMSHLVDDIIKSFFQYKITVDSITLYKISERQREYYLEKILGDNFAQLFHKIDGMFSENNSIRKKIISNGFIELLFEIENEVNEFRFDPSNQPTLISNFSISLVYEDDVVENIDNYHTENLIKLDDGKYLVLSTDPKVIFFFQKNKKPIAVSFKYYIHNDLLFEEKIQNFLNLHNRLLMDNKKLSSDLSKIENDISILENQIDLLFEEKIQNFLNLHNRLLMDNKKLSSDLSKIENDISILENQIDILLAKYKKSLLRKNNKLISMKKEYSSIIKSKNSEIERLKVILNNIENSRGYQFIMKVKNLFKLSDYKILKYSRLFDKKYYLANNKDVQDANLDPIMHFLNYGWREGRNPSRKFDINAYLTKYADVKEANLNPLLHYIKYGKKEGRCIQPVEIGWIDLVNNIYSLLKNNPSLISKFMFLLKSKGVKYAIRKVMTKAESQIKLEEYKKTLCFDNIFPMLGYSNLIEIKEFYKNNEISKPIDIIIPVYNGFEFLDKLFLSIKENTSLPYRLLISDDKSPDERVIPFIENFIAENPNINITFIKNIENQGFLKTVNLLSKYVENHMVLLNTDTEVPKFWLERLMYPIFKDRNIASTTPFTNSGTICSFPNYLMDNKDIYNNLALEQVDSIFQLVDVEKTMLEVPTGVGFCMGVNFDVVKEIGMFDEIYGKGYGEENDWCQRAINAGYKNMHITNLFVYHKHGGSFLSEDKIRYINEHYQILLSKFPSYDEQIQSTIKNNALEGLRALVRCIIDFKYITKENVLIIDHELGGGANLYCKQKIDSLLAQEKGVVFLSYNINKNKYFISFFTSGFSQQFNLINLDLLTKVLDLFVINEILLNGVVSFPNVYEILSLALKIKERKDNIKLIFPVHDYFCISPSYTLLTENNIYRGVPIDLEKHSQFLKNSNSEFKLFCSETDVVKWQDSWRSFLLSCDEVLCFSHSSEEIILAAYYEIKDKLVYVPHDIKGTFDNIYDEVNKDSNRVIGILGNINLPKGSLVVKELVSYIDNRGLDIQIVLIGNIDLDITSNSFVKTGSYQKQDVPELLKKYKITEFLIPSIWPETYSYTTDEIMQLGYPITVFDLGAPAERVKLYEKGRVIEMNSGNYIEEICKVWR